MREFVTLMLASHLSSLWPLFAVPLLVVALLRPAVAMIEAMPAGSRSQRRLAFIASILPGVVFWCMALSAPHLMMPGAMHSAACFAHCAVLATVFAAVPLRACIRFGRQTASLAQLLRLKQPPSHRLESIASALRLRAWELPTNEPLCCVAGVFKPNLLVSTGALRLLSDEELRAALLHERAHWRSRETFWVSLAAFLNLNSLVPVPGSLEMFRCSGEYAADREAAYEADPLTLASSLLRLGRPRAGREQLATHLAAGENVIARARLLVCGEPSQSRQASVVATAGFLLAIGALAWLPVAVRWVSEIWCRR